MDPTPLKPILLGTSEELAHFLDSNCHNWSLYHNGHDLLSSLQATSYPQELLPIMKAEQVALDVWFKGCGLERKCSITDKDGQTWGSTLPHELLPLPYEYYQQRLAHSSNPYLRARYALLLWNAPKPYKHIRYAQAAIDNLFIALDTAECANEDSSRDCIDLLKRTCALAAAIHHRDSDAVSAVVDRFTGTTQFANGSRTALLRLIIKHTKLFKHADHELVLDSSRKLFAYYYEAKNFHTCEVISEIAAPYAQGLGLDPREWHRRLAEAFEGEASNRHPSNDDSSLMAIEFYSRAAKAYQLAGDPAAEERALLQAHTLKPKLKLHTINTEFTPEQTKLFLDDIRYQTDLLLGHGSDAILNFLACNERTIPDYTEIKARASEAKPTFMSMISVIEIDGNKNTRHSESSTAPERNLEREVSKSYSLALSFRLQYLVPVFVEGYQTGKINAESFCQYLDKCSWIAQPMTEHDISGDLVEYTWQPMLYPGIREFFEQLHRFIHETPKSASFVLTIDSLTLKIEGLLREVLQRMGAHTIATHKRHDLREVYFDDLLQLARTKDLLNESECYFLSYVFTPVGKNLRNDIAHGYYHLPERYSIHKAIFVLMALLRVTGFHLVSQSGEESATR